jgi:hypothetical protein
MSVSKQFSYYDDWRTQTFPCPQCNWTGKIEEMDKDYFRDLFDAKCPKCSTMLAIVSNPTFAETRAAAAAGHPEAIRELPKIERAVSRSDRFEEEKLTGPQQLPDLEGDRLEFVLDTEEHVGSERETYNILRCGDSTIWRELAFWEGYERFAELTAILEQKYGARFAGLKATWGGYMWLFGDMGVPPFHVEIVDSKSQKSGQ